MIDTMELPRALQGDDILGIGNDADDPMVTRFIVADRAEVKIGQILAAGAQVHALFRRSKRLRELLDLFLRKAQEVKGKALCRLSADAGQTRKLFR